MPGFVVGALLAGAVAGTAAATVAAGVFTAAFSWAAFGAAVVMGGLAKATAKKPQSSAPSVTAQGRLVSVRQPIVARDVVYGRCRKGGAMTFFHTSTDNQIANIVMTLTGHEVAAIGDVYFNDEVVPLSGRDATGKYAGYAAIFKSTGNEGSPQQPFQYLVDNSDGKWTDAHRQTGCSKIYARLVHNQDLFVTGIPNFTCIIKGVNDVYDPRNSPGEYGWSNNPALCLAHYLCNTDFGLGCDYATEIDEASLVAAANICDERVSLAVNTATFTADASTDAITLATGSRLLQYGDGVRVAVSGSPGTLPAGLAEGTTYYAIPFDGGTAKLATSLANALADVAIDITDAGSGVFELTYYDEPRYRVDGSFATSESPQNIIENLLIAMAGRAVQTGGKWFIFAGAYDAPTITLDENDFAGPIRVQTNLSRRDNANGVKGIFTDPSQAWQPVDFPAVASDTYKQQDNNERVWRDIDLSGYVISPTQAQRLAKIDLLAVRQGLSLSARFRLSALRCMTGRTVAITNTKLGWSAKAFDVLNLTFVTEDDGRLEVEMNLRETASAIYDWSTSEEQTVDLAPNTNLPDPTTVGTPSAATFTASPSITGRATIAWTAPANAMVDRYEVEIAADGAGSPTEYTLFYSGRDTQVVVDNLTVDTHRFRVRAFNVFGVAGEYASGSGSVTNGLKASTGDLYTDVVDTSNIVDSAVSSVNISTVSSTTWNGSTNNPPGYYGLTTVTFTADGSPVVIGAGFLFDGSTNDVNIKIEREQGSPAVELYANNTARPIHGSSGVNESTPVNLTIVDTPAAGSVTYILYARKEASTTYTFDNIYLQAIELKK